MGMDHQPQLRRLLTFAFRRDHRLRRPPLPRARGNIVEAPSPGLQRDREKMISVPENNQSAAGKHLVCPIVDLINGIEANLRTHAKAPFRHEIIPNKLF